MTTDRATRARQRLALDTMSADRPLDALLPGLAAPAPLGLPRTPVHPRVLESEVDGRREWGLILWENPGGPAALHTAVQGLLEATLLAELSRPPASVYRVPDRRFHAVRLFSYATLPFDPMPAIRAVGFRPVQVDAEAYQERLAAVGSEARATGRTIPAAPVAVWEATISHPSGELGDRLREIEAMMAERMGDDVWGKTPGGPSRLFATYLEKVFGEPIKPSLEGLRAMEMLVVQSTEQTIRWMPPLVFQALCDFIPIVANVVYGTKTSWAVCEAIEGDTAQPPLIRIEPKRAGEAPVHVPLGPHLLRWSMMPIHPGEQVDSLTAWVTHQFGADA